MAGGTIMDRDGGHKAAHTGGAILVTGATGLIGGHVAGKLLHRGERVFVLVREKDGRTAEERFASVCDFLHLSVEERSRVVVCPGSLDRDMLGLDEGLVNRLASEADRIVHCAAATGFLESRRPEAERVNIRGVESILAFAVRIGCRRFHHMSTVYAGGCDGDGVCGERLHSGGGFANVYEETKHRGERLVHDFCVKHGIGHTILRPSVVVGDSDRGRTFRFNGFYYPLNALFRLRNLFRDRNERARSLGIVFDNGSVMMPIRIECSEDAGINLVPVDFVARVAATVAARTGKGEIYHVAAREPVRVGVILDYLRRFAGIGGLRTVAPGFFSENSPSPLERMYNAYIEPYRPYMNDGRRFSTERTDRLLAGAGMEVPVFDYGHFERCMRFALETDWGGTLDVG